MERSLNIEDYPAYYGWDSRNQATDDEADFASLCETLESIMEVS